MQDKASLRKELLSKRDNIPLVVKKSKDQQIAERLFNLPEFKAATTIFFFASFRSEVDTVAMMERALDENKRIVLPKVEGQNLGLYEINRLDELIPGYMGIPEPSVLSEDRKIAISDVNAVIIPGAAFDETGNRVGYGGGFYDRLLAGIERDIPIIAPTYEEQIIDVVPIEPHDRKITIILTDCREIRLI